MTVALRSGGDKGPVTVAELNLKFIWDVVSRIKIGDKGKAYVVDRSGLLVADPDIGLVLRKTSMAELAHVQGRAGVRSADEPAMLSHDLAGTKVLTSMAPIDPLDWQVFVEQPVAEVYAKLNASILLDRRPAARRPGGVGAGRSARWRAAWCARSARWTKARGASARATSSSRSSIKTGDELEGLADQFNRMSGQLRESYAGLERKVEQRTGRADRGAGVPDRDQRGAARHQRLDHRRDAGVRGDHGKRDAAVRRADRGGLPLRRPAGAPGGARAAGRPRRSRTRAAATRRRRTRTCSAAASILSGQRADHRRHPRRPGLRPDHGTRRAVAPHDRRADAQGRRAGGRHRGRLARPRQDAAAADRPAEDLCRPGRDRDRERAPDQRDARRRWSSRPRRPRSCA